jgi:hypothetical protein
LYFLSSLLSCFLFLTNAFVLLISYRYPSSISHTIYSIPFNLILLNTSFIPSSLFCVPFQTTCIPSFIFTLPSSSYTYFQSISSTMHCLPSLPDTFHNFTCLRIYLCIHINFSRVLHFHLILCL